MQPAMTSTSSRAFQLIAALALAGVVVSSVSLRHHYGTSQTNYCDFGTSFNCDIVNRSIYSTVLGVPDALIGILGYALLLALATLYRTKAEAPFMLLIASTAAASRLGSTSARRSARNCRRSSFSTSCSMRCLRPSAPAVSGTWFSRS